MVLNRELGQAEIQANLPTDVKVAFPRKISFCV